MPRHIRLVCLCGQPMMLPDKYAGQHVQCPDCRAMLRIPTQEEDYELMRWFCACGQRLKARARSAGRMVHCPACSAEVKVPFIDPHSSFIERQLIVEDPGGVIRIGTTDAPPPADAPATFELADGDEGVIELDVIEAAEPATPSEEAGGAPPAPVPPSVPMHSVVDTLDSEEAAAEEEEGIHAHDLTQYFNVTEGAEAAKAGVMQVINGHWLYIPYALMGACMTNLFRLIFERTAGNIGLTVASVIVPAAASLFLWAGFLGCIKDGVFERSMGIERMIAHGWRHVVRFTVSMLLVAPVFLAIALLGAAWLMPALAAASLLGKLALLAGALFAGLVLYALFMVPAIISIVEEIGPLRAVFTGLRFVGARLGQLLSLSVTSLLVAGGALGVVFMFWWLARLLLYLTLPRWVFFSLEQFFGGLIIAAVAGQFSASLMLLYLSDVKEEKRLRQIQRSLRGPTPNPTLLYVAIAAAALGTLLLNRLLLKGF